MANYQKILARRLARARAKLALGKASKGDLRLLARIEAKERRKAEDEERRARLDYVIEKGE